MQPRITLITLTVDDLERAVEFYRDGLGLAADSCLPLGPHCPTGFVLPHNVGSVAEVDAVMAQAVRAGATLTKPAQATFYGGHAGYFQDLDGHLWEVAFNPGLDQLG